MDLNADAGESRDPSADEPLLEIVTSVSLACGVHAGSPAVLARLSELAARRGVGVGAHPGIVEGRKPKILSPRDADEAIRGQVATFREHSQAPLQHLKLHGTLYHAAREPRMARAIAETVRELRVPILVAQAGSPLERAARDLGVRVAAEAFLDRAYEPDGRLVARGRPGALLDDERAAAARALDVALRRKVVANNGRDLPVEADTLCVHADTPRAADLARTARKALEQAGVELRPMGAP
jgi:UPF0271 protein